MDYHIIWYNCWRHWDDAQWRWPGSIPQRSRLHKIFKGQSTNAHVCTITYLRIEALADEEAILWTALLSFLFFLICSAWLVLKYLQNHWKLAFGENLSLPALFSKELVMFSYYHFGNLFLFSDYSVKCSFTL